jgi:hypothetical protein
MTFRQIFAGRQQRGEIVGLFLAMLELIRQKRLVIQQDKLFGEIYIFLRKEEEEVPPGANVSDAAGGATTELNKIVDPPAESADTQGGQ